MYDRDQRRDESSADGAHSGCSCALRKGIGGCEAVGMETRRGGGWRRLGRKLYSRAGDSHVRWPRRGWRGGARYALIDSDFRTAAASGVADGIDRGHLVGIPLNEEYPPLENREKWGTGKIS